MPEPAKKRSRKKAAPDAESAEEVVRPAGEQDSEETEVYPAPPRREERLQKIIAAAGVTSRRKAEELITGGRVQVNGTTITELGAKADAELDHIRVDGKLLLKPGQGGHRLRYAILNKPKGYITSASDPEGRPTVMDFFPGGTRVFPVGRLDYQSEGLLVMTNDGELANLLTRAANKVQKVYLVKISGKPSEEALNQLRAGIMIDKGRTKEEKLGRVLTQPAGIRRVRDAENPWYEVTLTEGRNREIRKMFEEVGHFVEKIRRVAYGPLVLDVPPGETRELTPDEVLSLQRAARGIRTLSRMSAAPISVPPIRHKAKRGTGISRPGVKPPSRPILSEWRKKPAANPDAPARTVPRSTPRPATYERPAAKARPASPERPATGRPAASGKSFSDRPATNRPFGERPSTGGRPSASRPAGARPARPASRPSPRPAAYEPPDTPDTPSFGITIVREEAPAKKSFQDRPAKGRTGGSPFGNRPGAGRKSSGNKPGTGRKPGQSAGSRKPR